MDSWWQIPIAAILVPQYPLEMFVRGSLTYLGLLVILRIILKRQTGNLISSDLLVVVLIADAVQNGMSGDYKSVPDGLILVSTIIFWDYVVDKLCFHSKAFQRLVNPAPLMLVKHGRILRVNMRRELITEAELWVKLREEGVEKLAQVKLAFLESDGHISVIKVK